MRPSERGPPVVLEFDAVVRPERDHAALRAAGELHGPRLLLRDLVRLHGRPRPERRGGEVEHHGRILLRDRSAVLRVLLQRNLLYYGAPCRKLELHVVAFERHDALGHGGQLWRRRGLLGRGLGAFTGGLLRSRFGRGRRLGLRNLVCGGDCGLLGQVLLTLLGASHFGPHIPRENRAEEKANDLFCLVHRRYILPYLRRPVQSAAGYGRGAEGRERVKTQPCGEFARTARSPPIARANSREVQSPMPKPPFPDSSTVFAR